MNPIQDKRIRTSTTTSSQEVESNTQEEQRSQPVNPFRAVPNSDRNRYLENNGTALNEVDSMPNQSSLSNGAVNNYLNSQPVTYEFEPEVILGDEPDTEELPSEEIPEPALNEGEIEFEAEIIQAGTDIDQDETVTETQDESTITLQTDTTFGTDVTVDTEAIPGAGQNGPVEEIEFETPLVVTSSSENDSEASETVEAENEQIESEPASVGDVETPTAESVATSEETPVPEEVQPDTSASPRRRAGWVGGVGGGDGSEALVRNWQARVSRSALAIQEPSMPQAGSAPGRLIRLEHTSSEAQRRDQQRIPKEAARNISVPPQVETPPAPPASNPVPQHTQRIENASDKRLPNQYLPNLVQTPRRQISEGVTVGGNMPRLGQQPVDPNIFQLLITPGALELADIPENQRNGERRQVLNALTALNQPFATDQNQGNGKAVPLIDQGPQPIPPLPAQMQTPVATVVARLLAQPAEATSNVMKRLRTIAYPNGVLQKQCPQIGQQLESQIRPRLVTELRDIATAAGVSGNELDSLISDRQNELDREASASQEEIQTAAQEAREGVSESGQKTLNTVAGACQAMEEEIINRQEEASGGNDPTVINARRDLIIRWMRNHVKTQTTNYKKAGEKREQDLSQGQRQRENAYNATAQREEYRILNPSRPAEPRDTTNQVYERHLQDLAAGVRSWTREQITGLQTSVRRLKITAKSTTRRYRSTIETAGNNGIEASRQWAEDRILEGQSWWERFKARISRWFGESRDINERWEVRRTQETRDGIARDLIFINQLHTAVQRGATKEQLLQQQNLTAEQRAIIQEYFDLPAGRHPLDVAAARLRQRLAANHRAAAVPIFEQELLALPDSDFEKLNTIGRVMRRGFDAAQIAQDIHAQLDNLNSDEAAMLRSLEGLNAIQGAAVRKLYKVRYRRDMDLHMRQAFDSDEMDQARLRLEGRQAAADADALHDAMGFFNTDEETIMNLLRGRSQAEIDAIRAEYRRRHGEGLEEALNSDLDEGNEQDQAAALLRGDRDTADAIELDEAMRGDWFGWGTTEEDIEGTYQRVRDEVAARAQREGWNSQQMDAEIRRRTRQIEARFGERYANVEEYHVPGMEGQTVLRQAFASEMNSGPQRNLANALADNNLVAADAARIEIERRSLWASDETMNNVLRSQYERSLQATRLDQGPARQRRIRREMRLLLQRRKESGLPPYTEDELSSDRMRMERQMERDMEDEAQRRGRINMEALEQAYSGSYNRPLWYTIATNMSGNDRRRAQAMQRQGGRLTALQDVEYATSGDGTDEDALRNRLGRMTRTEINALRRDWEARHPGESFDDMLRGELSGRDESDIMDMVRYGAPESASERIKQERRRMNRELDDLTGVFGGLAAGNEEAWLRRQMDELDDIGPRLHRRDLSDEERRELRDELDMRVERVNQAVLDHRRAIDSVTNTAAQIASLAVALTVGAALTALSGGALGPVMIAVIASVAATVTTMGTKALIQGGSYGGEDIGIDLAVGVVDALTAAATAGMGGRILRGASGVAQQAARPTRLTQAAGRLAQGRLGRQVGRLPGASTVGRGVSSLNRAESGFLVRGITGQNPLARMAQSNSQSMRLFAEFLAEGVENAVSSIPSAFTQTALTDETWQGNPLLNLLEGTAMGSGTSVVMGGVVQGGMRGAGSLYRGARTRVRMATQEGRLTEANRIIGDAYQSFRQRNPNASYVDFLGHPEGIRVHTEVQQRGLIPAPETAGPRGAEEHAVTRPVEEISRTRVSEGEVVPPETGALPTRPVETLSEHGVPSVRPEEPASGRVTEPSIEGRPAPETAAGSTQPIEAPARPAEVDPRTQALREALPEGMRQQFEVEVKPGLEGRTVKVVPDVEGGLVRGVKIEAGPDAQSIDIMMHAPVAQAMQRYSGLLGRLRALKAWFYLAKVGSEGWEAQLELQKLPGIVQERMQQLTQADLAPSQRAGFIDEINGLSHQIDAYQSVLESPELRDREGRGFVAAEDKPRKIRGVADASRRPDRSNADKMVEYERTEAKNSPLEAEYGRVYQIGERWQENGRVYRMVEVYDAEGRVELVREEIQGLDPVTGKRIQKWVQRGSESARLSGEVGETASIEMVASGKLNPGETGRAIVDHSRLQNESGHGFDGAYIRFNEDGTATVVIIEAKNYPNRYVPLKDFTAIGGDPTSATNRLKENFDQLKAYLESPEAMSELNLTPNKVDQVMAALDPATRNVEIQIHTTPKTKIGSRERGSVLEDLEIKARKDLNQKNLKVVHRPIDHDSMKAAIKQLAEADRIGQESVRLHELAGDEADTGSLAYKQAQTMLWGEAIISEGLVSPIGLGRFIDEGGNMYQVVVPGEGGAVPTSDKLARTVLQHLKTQASSSAAGKGFVLLDMTELTPAQQNRLLKRLRREPNSANLLNHLWILNRTTQQFDEATAFFE